VLLVWPTVNLGIYPTEVDLTPNCGGAA